MELLPYERVRFKVLQQVKQLLMYRTPVSSPKALDQSTAGAAARWATRSAKLGGHRVCAPGVGAPVPCGQVLNSSAPMGRANENQRLTEELAATREALRQVNRSEPRP